MRKLAATIAITLALAGCQQISDFQTRQAADRAAEDEAACKASGVSVGTDAYAQCLEDRAEQRRADTQAAAARANQQQGVTCATIGAQVICKAQ